MCMGVVGSMSPGALDTVLWSEPCLLPLEVPAHCLVLWAQCWASGFHGPLSPALGDAAEIQMNTKALLKQAITRSGDRVQGWPHRRLAGHGQGAERVSGKRQQCGSRGKVWSLFILLSNHISKVSYFFPLIIKPCMLHSSESEMLQSTFNECVYPKSGVWKSTEV